MDDDVFNISSKYDGKPKKRSKTTRASKFDNYLGLEFAVERKEVKKKLTGKAREEELRTYRQRSRKMVQLQTADGIYKSRKDAHADFSDDNS